MGDAGGGNASSSSSASWDFNTKTAVFGLGAGAVGLCLGPITAAAAVAGTLYTRTSAISLSTAFNRRLDHVLRNKAAAGYCLTLVQRFSKGIDRISSLSACCVDSTAVSPVAPGHQPERRQPIANKQELPILHHSGILVRLERSDSGEQCWIKIEFVKEGLQFELLNDAPRLRASYLVEPCPLQGVSPAVLADCLKESKNRTYNALTWNCNHVSDMIWDRLLTRSSRSAGWAGDPEPLVSSLLAAAAAAANPQEGLCKICMAEPKCIAFLPCGHYDTCEACASRLETCPFCQTSIRQRHRIYGD